MALSFEIVGRSAGCAARRGVVRTAHGAFETPAFMPVGTRGTVKGVLPRDLEAVGAQICLGNTYHLMLRPGSAVVARLGGLHAFMNWGRPILTDSGGYQAFSMADINTVTDDGVRFRSIIDGREVHLTPERAIEVQNELGADIIMAFDDCPPAGEPGEPGDGRQDPTADEAGPSADPRARRAMRRDRVGDRADYLARVRAANERTVRWLERCKRAHARSADQSLFGIVQGGTDLDLRTWSAQRISAVDLPGYAIGGVAVGETTEQILSVVRHTAPLLPETKPRYLMGVGYERDLLGAVRAGVDMFDCVLPTRNGRNANAFTPTGQIRLRNASYAEDPAPIQPGCDCPACATGPQGRVFSRGYLRHLFQSGEMLGPMLVTLHNLRHFQRFMADVRSTIDSGDWPGLVRRWPVVGEGLA
ncbi:MAG: tRNA guanosine(34) transglycosylase Tgt [Phycisphaerae bacterium]|nr:tRNA guanosine(34) transglycosylase Tgt [Phycisphaerae bacterium]